VYSHSRMLNELAQKRRSIDDGIAWFQTFSSEDQRSILRELSGYCLQARATREDGVASIALSGIKSTDTPAVLIVRGERLMDQLAKIGNLMLGDFVKSFRLLVALLGVADTRRRERDCRNGCTHSWHQLDG
jgi:hypothetical protein